MPVFKTNLFANLSPDQNRLLIKSLELSAKEFGKNLQSELSKMFSGFTPSQRHFFRVMMGQSKIKLSAFQSLPSGFDYFGKLNKSFETLAQHGWFISLNRTPLDMWSAAENCFLSGQIDKGNEMMVEHFRELLDAIQKRARIAFPLRGHILEKAFDAHRRKEYELSIPVMLAQIDGIGEDIFGQDVSSTSRHPKKIDTQKKYIEGKLDAGTKKILGGYFFLITSLLPINASSNERKKFSSPFNRHLVLHGIDVDYATEINALKAASWLQYVVSLK
jgi:hypothetical protein